MERVNQFSFYNLGRTLKALERYKAFTEDIPAAVIFWDLLSARGELRALLDGRPIPLQVSRTSAGKLIQEIESLLDQFMKEDEAGNKQLSFPKDGDPPVSQWRVEFLCSNLLTPFETVFSEEMRETATYFVPRRGIYHTPALVDAADETFPAEVLSSIPQKTRDDWKSAGRCLAFGLHSASGFHVARAVEGTVETYYQLFCNKPGQTLRGWQDYYDTLEKARTVAGQSPIPSEKTLTELLQMKDDYRNPIMHPRAVLSESDARMLFANGESLIIAMAQEIKEAQKGIQPQLALVSGSAA